MSSGSAWVNKENEKKSGNIGLPNTPFAYDTETDRKDPSDPESTYTCLVQICPADAVSLNDVTVFEDDDAVGYFLDQFEDTPYDCECHAFNLGNYEFEWLRGALISRCYANVEYGNGRGKMSPHTWRVMFDRTGVFKLQICSREGHVLTIKDDMKIFHPALSMKAIASSIRTKHPDWWPSDMATKEHVDRYNDGWHFYNNNREQFIQYSKVDAFSQAMITRYIIRSGMNRKISAAGFGMAEALYLMYGKEEWKNKKDFVRQWPPLDAAMQEIAEDSLIGGYVYGETGTYHANFTKLDFKSSYPYEYAYGVLFRGRVRRISPDAENYEHIRRSRMWTRWFLVSFDFKLKEGRCPCINAKEAGRTRFINLKMTEGRVIHRLYCESLLLEMREHYDISNIQIHEMWYARKAEAVFTDVIKYNFDKKENSKGADKVKAKLNLNGGIHGKTITKTHRQKRIFAEDGEDDVRIWEDEITRPEYCFMIGFTALENARARLLKYCRVFQDAGYKIYMCDTDSIITDCPEDRVRELIGDWLVPSGCKDMEQILGRFEIEATFSTLKCWGLKRYCEIEGYIPGRSGRFVGLVVGTAFAGMHDSLQSDILPGWNTDGVIYNYTQLSKRRLHDGRHGTVLEPTVKHAGARNIWWKDEFDEMDAAIARLKHMEIRHGEQYVLDYYRDVFEQNSDKQSNEDMVAYLQDVRYDEIDPFWKKHIAKAYREAMKNAESMEDETWQ